MVVLNKSLFIFNFKIMKKIIKNLTTFILIFIIFNHIVAYFYELPMNMAVKEKTHMKYLKWTDIESDQNEYDLIFLGSSRGYCAYNPIVTDSILSSNSYNMCTGNQDITQSYFILKEILKYQTPSYIVYEMFLPSFPKQTDFYPVFSNAKFMSVKGKIDMIVNGYGVEGAINLIFPILKHKNYIRKDLLTFLKSRSIDIPLRFEQGLFVTRDRKGRYAIRGRDYNIHQLNLDERHGMAAPSAGFFDFRNRVVLGAEELLNEGERFVLEAHVHLAGTGSSSVKVPSSEDIENFIINGLPATHIIFDEEGKGRLFLPKRRDVGWIARTSTALRFIEEESEKLEYLAAHYTIRDVVDFKIVEHEVLRHDRAGVVTRPTNQVTLGLATAA